MGVIRQYSVNGLNPSTITTSGSSVVYFPDLPGANLWNVGAVGVNTGVSSQYKGLQPTATNNAGGLQVDGNSVLDGQRFQVLASGNATFAAGEASTTVKVGLYLSLKTPGVSPSYNTIYEMTMPAASDVLDGVAYPWSLGADFQGDTASGILQIAIQGFSQIDGGAGGGTTGAKTALTGVNFAVDPSRTNGGMTFVVGVTFGSATAGNSAQLKQFQVALF